MTDKTFSTILSVLINSRINAEKFNEHGINNAHIKSVDSALAELHEMKSNGEIMEEVDESYEEEMI